jgi:hypothetical protein
VDACSIVRSNYDGCNRNNNLSGFFYDTICHIYHLLVFLSPSLRYEIINNICWFIYMCWFIFRCRKRIILLMALHSVECFPMSIHSFVLDYTRFPYRPRKIPSISAVKEMKSPEHCSPLPLTSTPFHHRQQPLQRLGVALERGPLTST